MEPDVTEALKVQATPNGVNATISDSPAPPRW